ncbi:MAG: glycoside-pentoside-hexuronide (GPH):cation symporter [Myxococcota bacterium]
MSAPATAGAAEPGQEPASDARLPLSIKIAYGAPNFAGAAMAIPIAVHLSIFYSDVVLVPLGFIALAKAVARAFDALTDPIMGWVSDRTRTSWGRRRPWIALGAPLAAVAFVAMFSPPEGITPLMGGLWLATTYILYYVFHTIYAIPHYGLGPELTTDYKERSTLFGWEQGFSVLGTMVAAGLPALLIASLGDRRAYTTFAALFAVVLVVLYGHLVWRIRERPDFANRPPNPLVPGVRRVLRNRVYRILLAVYVIGATTGAIPGTLMPFYTTYVLQPEEPARWIGVYLAAYFGAGFLFLPFWVLAARRFGKKPVWLASFVTGVSGSATLFLIGPGQLWLAFWVLVWAGASFGARLFLGPAIQADVIDYDELHTGKRREAQYGSLWSVVTKFTVIPSMSIPLAVLATLGYEPNVEQSETVKFAIRAIFGLLPAATGLVAFVVACFYPISESVHRRIWEGIAQHKRGEAALDPVTGRRIPPPADRGVDEDSGWFLDHFSPGEIRRALSRGPGSPLRDAVAWLGFCVLLTIASVWATLAEVGSLESPPGIGAVLSIVVAGFSFTAACFHAIRIRAARRLRARPLPDEILRAHLGDDRMRRGTT